MSNKSDDPLNSDRFKIFGVQPFALIRMSNWATRCAVMASECLKSTGQYGEAALQLIRLTSEDADLRSAVLLEQAALCFLRSASRLNASKGQF